MRSLKDSRQLGIDSVEYLKGLHPRLHSDPKISAAILAAYKVGADWQLRTSERNYRNKQNKELNNLKREADEWNDRHKR